MRAPLDFDAARELTEEIRRALGWRVLQVLGPRTRGRWERLRRLADLPLGSRWSYAGRVHVLAAVRPVDFDYQGRELFMVLVARGVASALVRAPAFHVP